MKAESGSEVRCGWCRRPPCDYPTCDSSPCGLLVAELDIACAVMDEHEDAPGAALRGGGATNG